MERSDLIDPGLGWGQCWGWCWCPQWGRHDERLFHLPQCPGNRFSTLQPLATTKYQLSSLYLGFDVLPWLLLGWSWEEGEGKEKEKTKVLKYKSFNIWRLCHCSLVTVDIIRFLDQINQSVSKPVFIIKPEHNLQSGLVNLQKWVLIFLIFLKIFLFLKVTWQPDRSSNITEKEEPEKMPLALKYVRWRVDGGKETREPYLVSSPTLCL